MKKSESELFLELIDLIADNAIDQCICEWICSRTGMKDCYASGMTMDISTNGKEILQGIYSAVIGEMCMGIAITEDDKDKIMDEIVEHLLVS